MLGVILGSAFSSARLGGVDLEPVTVETDYGPACLHRYSGSRLGWVLFRHGLPHRYLPHQVPHRAHLLALHQVGCRAMLVTSSVGILDPALPLFQPMLVEDLLMPENRMADGSPCTLHVDPKPAQAHLVLEEGLFSTYLNHQLEALMGEVGYGPPPRVIFSYVPGPRTKTRAENRYWRASGAQVNSMTLAPEVVLANELGLPTAGLVVGHKYSCPDVSLSLPPEKLEATLEESREALERLTLAFLERATAPAFGNGHFSFA
ncbi:MAG: 5'-methylthioadenosine phosphorylase [Armatimonadetes bacterium]|nr:5'-methylthioadenosine phosphorylase [Armatimonadota bacterium]